MPLKKLDTNVQRRLWCLQNRYEKYVAIGKTPKMDVRFEKARLYTTKSGVVRALPYFRKFFNDDSISVLLLVVTLREFE